MTSAEATDAALATVLETALRAGAGPGVTAALVGRHADHLRAAGLADVASSRPMTPETQVAIGSVSKTFTAATILRLRDLGRLSLSDPFVRHIPEAARFRVPFPDPTTAGSATIRDLLRHTAGLPCEAPSPDLRRWDPAPVSTVLADPASITWAIAPGSAHKYSNLGFDLLGEVIARVSGQPYEAAVVDLLLEPLGMANTTFRPTTTAATGHGPADPGGHRRPAGTAPPAGASGGWWSTAVDLASWVRLQITPELVPAGWQAASIREAHRPMVVTHPGLEAAYGLGWRVVHRRDHLHIGHGGLTIGFEARIEADIDRGVGAVVLLNGVGPAGATTDIASNLFGLAEDAATDRHVATDQIARRRIAKPVANPVDPIGLAGRYREVGFASMTVVEVTADGLWMHTDDDPGGPLVPTDDPDRFALDHGRLAGEWLVVLRDELGRIDGINVAGYPMTRLPGSAEDPN